MESTARDIVYRDNWIPNYVAREKIAGKVVLMTPAGRWCSINEEQFNLLKSVALPRDLFLSLERSGVITTENNAQKNFLDYKVWNEGKYTWPDLHIIETTKACNLSCTYCHMSPLSLKDAKVQGFHLEQAGIERIIDTVLTSPQKELHVEFQGGESLVNFDVMQAGVIYAKKQNSHLGLGKELTFSVVSNLTALKKKHCEFFKEHNVSVCTTIDGPKFIHDKQRITSTGKGSFDLVCKGINLLQNCGLKAPGVLSVITKNSSKYLPQLVEMFRDIGITDLSFIFVHSMGAASNNWGEIGISWKDESDAYTSLLDYVFTMWQEGVFIGERKVLVTLEKLFSNKDTSFTDFRNPCGIARGQITYDSKGAIFTCDEGRSFPKFKIGDEKDEANSNQNKLTIPDVVDTELVDSLLSESLPNYKECDTCAYRPMCGLCPVQMESTPAKSQSAYDNHGCLMTQLVFDYCLQKIVVNQDLMKSYYSYSLLHPNVVAGS